ncbi:hypothetical protein VDGL01_00508 [Verticillium dahliae]
MAPPRRAAVNNSGLSSFLDLAQHVTPSKLLRGSKREAGPSQGARASLLDDDSCYAGFPWRMLKPPRPVEAAVLPYRETQAAHDNIQSRCILEASSAWPRRAVLFRTIISTAQDRDASPCPLSSGRATRDASCRHGTVRWSPRKGKARAKASKSPSAGHDPLAPNVQGRQRARVQRSDTAMAVGDGERDDGLLGPRDYQPLSL